MKYFVLILFNFDYSLTNYQNITKDNNIDEAKIKKKEEILEEKKSEIRFILKHKKKIVIIVGIVCVILTRSIVKNNFWDETGLKEDKDERNAIMNCLQFPETKQKEEVFYDFNIPMYSSQCFETKEKEISFESDKEYFHSMNQEELFHMILQDPICSEFQKYLKSLHFDVIYKDWFNYFSRSQSSSIFKNKCFVNDLTKYEFSVKILNFDYKDKNLEQNKESFKKFNQFETYLKSFSLITKQEQLTGIKYPDDNFVPPEKNNQENLTLKQIHSLYLNYYPGNNTIYGVTGLSSVISLDQMDIIFL